MTDEKMTPQQAAAMLRDIQQDISNALTGLQATLISQSAAVDAAMKRAYELGYADGMSATEARAVMAESALGEHHGDIWKICPVCGPLPDK